ncbi:hypothetical protein M406DRAFT_244768 [Cryphonectria parasitica EP155]|uniref:dolichol kinase n=1 Tax=Cryphonectria parasitica (strain ATCC 38755 / EP155) TaxID=660469 RepID=A0A9P5CUS9_CRYP1|nr:uncharacterized protein M406DRAFT_244768 [Cryphonectria parasitica EP155]KAF3770882.1 hypothetical protein M406DRAFT_244768 [Cryphonectria parasitica EP155]
MPDTLRPPGPTEADETRQEEQKDEENLRELSRSPHPYHRQKWELLEPSDRVVARASTIPTHGPVEDIRDQLLPAPSFTKDSTPATDSGTEADDEIFVKKLPAPKAKLHKGLRGRHEALSGSGTPLLTPTVGDGDRDGILSSSPRWKKEESEKRRQAKRLRRNRELVRRGTEVAILGVLARTVIRNPVVQPFVAAWKDELILQSTIFAALLLLYPLRVAAWAYKKGEPLKSKIPLSIPLSFDPAPALYPQLLPLLVAFLTAANLKDVILPNLVLGIASIPRSLVPTSNTFEVINPIHWLLTCLPLALNREKFPASPSEHKNWSDISPTSPQDLVFLYPLHQSLSLVLYHLTTSSLLTAELELLSISLINLLILSRSPQAVVLQSVLWLGGLGVLIFCAPVIEWSISLARVPKWRLRRNTVSTRTSLFGASIDRLSAGLRLIPAKEGLDSETEDSAVVSGLSTDEEGTQGTDLAHRRSIASQMDGLYESIPLRKTQTSSDKPVGDLHAGLDEPESFSLHPRRRTLPFAETMMKSSKTHTSSGRQKRRASSSVRFFYGLTPGEANRRKLLYAAWAYASIVAVVLLPIGFYVRQYATAGHYPIGWAVGYVLGDIHWFRMQVIMSTWLDWAFVLPDLPGEGSESCHLGWVEHLRHASIGEANTRLCLAAWWVAVIILGLAVVFRLSPYYEVDTRRKIFHFMMVSMFLPATFIDPTWCALALAIVLAIFLLLDLLRASQLPPLSKPIRDFLQPYTDGRDHQGPVVISHIFLLIGCAIPLWLSLASLPRTGTGNMMGWETPARELSMVAGVVCVGLGDAAASLIGRRWGKHKWFWKGGKSLEGSVAFAMAVFAGLVAANLWLRVGGWPVSSFDRSLSRAETVTGFCASLSSLTEAVLTGGNDNVVVPVVLWTCVKATGL